VEKDNEKTLKNLKNWNTKFERNVNLKIFQKVSYVSLRLKEINDNKIHKMENYPIKEYHTRDMLVMHK